MKSQVSVRQGIQSVKDCLENSTVVFLEFDRTSQSEYHGIQYTIDYSSSTPDFNFLEMNGQMQSKFIYS